MGDPAETTRDTIRDNVKEVCKAAQESTKAASKTSEDMQADLEALRDDFLHLAEQLGLIVSKRSTRAWKRTKEGVGDVCADAETLARKAGGELNDLVQESLQTRPFTMLAIAAGVGFLVGASWRR